MRAPVRHISGNLLWTNAGTPIAVYRLSGLVAGWADTNQINVRDEHTALFRALPREWALFGLCASTDPASILKLMIEGIDLEAHPQWLAECQAQWDALQDVQLGERSFWLTFPVPLSNASRSRATLAAGLSSVREQMGLGWAHPRAHLIKEAQESAAAVAAGFPAAFDARPATPGQTAWFVRHGVHRGQSHFPVPEAGDDVLNDIAPIGRGPWGGLILDECARGGSAAKMTPTDLFGRRVLAVTDSSDPLATDASYQSHLVIADAPINGMTFPGTASYLGDLDLCGIDVDFVVLGSTTPNDEATKRIRRSVRDLEDQHYQRDGVASTGQHQLDSGGRLLRTYEAALADPNEVSVTATFVLVVAGPTPEEATAQAREVADYFARDGFRLTQPLGAQRDLWWATQPGTPSSPTTRSLAQVMTSAGLAASLPLTTNALGDPRGIPVALNISTPRGRLVCLDSVGQVTDEIDGGSASIGVAGDSGAGKSVTMKTIAAHLVTRGATMMAIDRTSTREWAFFAGALTDSLVVDLASPRVSMDPLRLFPGQEGGRVAQSFLTALLNVSPTSPQGALLGQVLEYAYRSQHDLMSLGDVIAHLESGPPETRDLARLARVFAGQDLGRVIFDPNLPVAQLSSPAVVFSTSGLALPSNEEIATEHLFRQMSLEKIFGRAIYALLFTTIQRMTFADTSQLAVAVLDEAWSVTTSSEAEAAVSRIIRDGRKHLASAILGSQDPAADFGSPTLQGLIPTRLVGRQKDKDMARGSLNWLGLDPNDAGLLELLMKHSKPGELLMRDSRGRAGRVKWALPANPALRRVVMTTPKVRSQQPELSVDGHAGDTADVLAAFERATVSS